MIRLAVVLVLSVVVLIGTGCGGSASTTLATTAAGEPAAEAPTVSSDSTTLPVESTDVEVTTTAEAPDILLGAADSHDDLKVKVGERVRIVLKPYVNDSVKAVKWDYVPIVVREVDSGTRVIEGVVVEAWLEVEAVVAGPVTVRALYEYSHGSARATWVAYLIVSE